MEFLALLVCFRAEIANIAPSPAKIEKIAPQEERQETCVACSAPGAREVPAAHPKHRRPCAAHRVHRRGLQRSWRAATLLPLSQCPASPCRACKRRVESLSCNRVMSLPPCRSPSAQYWACRSPEALHCAAAPGHVFASRPCPLHRITVCRSVVPLPLT